MSTYWRPDGTWACDRHLVSKFPAVLKYCYYSDCAKHCSGRPAMSKRTHPEIGCAWAECGNIRRKTSKYCSDDCRKHYARSRYVERKRSSEDGLQQESGRGR